MENMKYGAEMIEDTIECKLTLEQVIACNKMAKTNWERAQGMLDGMNAILGTKYGWLCARVTIFEKPDESACFKYAGKCFDAYAVAWRHMREKG